MQEKTTASTFEELLNVIPLWWGGWKGCSSKVAPECIKQLHPNSAPVFDRIDQRIFILILVKNEHKYA